ncbi:hypothetical protein ACIBVL_20490 [Streptomyces sp. NPDC049687]|uniref:hypothetical protein n=1 Tax=Streptomyces sp. NPDC049687 TaxID=3365596 RepID=UPI0037AE2C50
MSWLPWPPGRAVWRRGRGEFPRGRVPRLAPAGPSAAWQVAMPTRACGCSARLERSPAATAGSTSPVIRAPAHAAAARSRRGHDEDVVRPSAGSAGRMPPSRVRHERRGPARPASAFPASSASAAGAETERQASVESYTFPWPCTAPYVRSSARCRASGSSEVSP